MEPILKVENLIKTYGTFEAVKGISFAVYGGEIFSLIGPNGAGKSTTLKMVATILEPTSGTITVANYQRGGQDDSIRKVISYLPEEAGAYKNLSGKQYLEFMASLYADHGDQRNAYVETAVGICGLGNKLSEKIKTYSKGMTRKLLIARSVMTKPKLAILDEPTSGLDIVNGLEVRQAVRNLAKDGMAVLLSSHNMLEIELLSDRVGIIHQGTLREVGTPQELKAKYHVSNLEELFVQIAHS